MCICVEGRREHRLKKTKKLLKVPRLRLLNSVNFNFALCHFGSGIWIFTFSVKFKWNYLNDGLSCQGSDVTSF